MEAEETVLERIERRELQLFENLSRMDEETMATKTLKWTPPGRNVYGRSRRSWYEGIGEEILFVNFRKRTHMFERTEDWD